MPIMGASVVRPVGGRMAQRVVIIEGHPDPTPGHLCHALADAYAEGAKEAGHLVQRIRLATLEFPWVRRKGELDKRCLPPVLVPNLQAIGEADHLVFVYPLWLGTMPALLKAFLEQMFRPGFAFAMPRTGRPWTGILKGKSARIVVTMGMPALFYRWCFGAHGLKSLERSILRFSGIGPISESLFGMVEAVSDAKRKKWLATMRRLGASAQ